MPWRTAAPTSPLSGGCNQGPRPKTGQLHNCIFHCIIQPGHLAEIAGRIGFRLTQGVTPVLSHLLRNPYAGYVACCVSGYVACCACGFVAGCASSGRHFAAARRPAHRASQRPEAPVGDSRRPSRTKCEHRGDESTSGATAGSRRSRTERAKRATALDGDELRGTIWRTMVDYGVFTRLQWHSLPYARVDPRPT